MLMIMGNESKLYYDDWYGCEIYTVSNFKCMKSNRLRTIIPLKLLYTVKWIGFLSTQMYPSLK